MASTNAAASTAATNIPTTTETVVLTFVVPPENNPGGEGLQIDATVAWTAGAGTTSAIVRVRQGSGITGAVVGAAIQEPATASVPNSISAQLLDPTLSYPAGNTYSLTIQQNAATGAGTAIYASAFTTPCTGFGG